MSSTYIMVALGGAVGAMLRHASGALAMRAFGPGFPYGTLMVNLAGSFLIGVAIVVLGQFALHRFSPLMVTGVLGGFTTFSAFSLDIVTLIERGEGALAALYALGSVAGGVAMAFAGIVFARGVLA